MTSEAEARVVRRGGGERKGLGPCVRQVYKDEYLDVGAASSDGRTGGPAPVAFLHPARYSRDHQHGYFFDRSVKSEPRGQKQNGQSKP